MLLVRAQRVTIADHKDQILLDLALLLLAVAMAVAACLVARLVAQAVQAVARKGMWLELVALEHPGRDLLAQHLPLEIRVTVAVVVAARLLQLTKTGQMDHRLQLLDQRQLTLVEVGVAHMQPVAGRLARLALGALAQDQILVRVLTLPPTLEVAAAAPMAGPEITEEAMAAPALSSCPSPLRITQARQLVLQLSPHRVLTQSLSSPLLGATQHEPLRESP